MHISIREDDLLSTIYIYDSREIINPEELKQWQ